jgi:hypothetical protein
LEDFNAFVNAAIHRWRIGVGPTQKRPGLAIPTIVKQEAPAFPPGLLSQ